MIGNRFCKLVIVEEITKRKFKCLCDCGAKVDVYLSQLVSGNNRSCGCLAKEQLITRNTVHGLSKNPAYSNWKDMLKRCFNPNNKRYSNYGGRGISVHPDFKSSFPKFLEEIGEKPEGNWSVGRIDNNGWYTYGNIRWETVEQQSRNHSKQSNNTSGVTGVKFSSKIISGNVYTSWIASWNIESNVKKTKSFSCEKYGYEKAKQLAIEYRLKMISELNCRGFDYAESHGTEKGAS